MRGNRGEHPARLALVDDDPTVLEMLPAYFDTPDLLVTLKTLSAENLFLALEDQPVDLVLTDIRMPGISGIDLVKNMRKCAPHIPVIGVTSYDLDEYVIEMLRAGAAGLVLKASPRSEFIFAVRQALEGKTFVSPTLAGVIRKYLRPYRPVGYPNLTSREVQVLSLVLDGLQNHEIAEQLHISTPTVKNI